MGVTITVDDLSVAMRVGLTSEETQEMTRLLAYATEVVVKHASDAPDIVHNTAAWRLVGYMYDQPFAGVGVRYANALRNSGAASVLLPYREHRGGSTGDDTEVSGNSGGGDADLRGVLRWPGL